MLPLAATGFLTSHAIAINESGQIAGTAISGTDQTAEQWPLLWSGETVTKLETIAGAPGTARAINDLGFIAGNTLVQSENHLLLWREDSLIETIPISGGVGWANGLNNAGQLVGTIEKEPELSSAFLWEQGSFTDLGTLGGSSSGATDLNDAGQIVGSASISGDLSSHAFLWQAGEMAALARLSEVLTDASAANGINNPGVIVGQAELDGEARAVMWQNGQIIDLNVLLPPETNWERLVAAEDINDEGWIVGTGLMAGERRGFLLKPLPLVHQRFLPMIALVGQFASLTPTATPTLVPTATPTMEPTNTPTPIPGEAVDLANYMVGDGRLYEVQHSSGSQARHQTQIDAADNKRFYHTKGNEIEAEWEELWSTRSFIYRGTDTSPGNDEYYTLYEGSTNGSPWSPRFWKVGETFERNPYVIFFRKSDCRIVASGFQRSWLRFEDKYDRYTFASGITLNNVIKLAWLLHPDGQPIENYFYAEDYGLVGWGSNDRGFSYISEIHGPGQRPDNTREVISCLNDLEQPLLDNPALNFGPLPEPYASRVK
jgi:probable HAF family extracellular repeat protein